MFGRSRFGRGEITAAPSLGQSMLSAAWAPKGQRLVDKVRQGKRKTATASGRLVRVNLRGRLGS